MTPLRHAGPSFVAHATLMIAVFSLSPSWGTAAELVDYVRQIKPILHERCYACHGALKQEGGLRLDTAALAIRGGESGAAIVPGNTADSVLLARISATDESERMPPEGEPLTPLQIALIRTWIEQKAGAPADEQPESDPKSHWSFQAPVKSKVPHVAATRWQRNPIDAFIAARHAEHHLIPQQPVDKGLWLRRVSLDLVGLPPTELELQNFMADTSADAEDRVVSRLLDSPQYGERWGRHWMDIWRYSDWWGLGAEMRNSHKHIWHWRDWIVESLNADKGYDQMLREMLAADELYPNDLDKLRAGGFLARQYFKFNRTSWLDEVVEHTSKSMIGLTFNCAKCHDHKFDPISHVEYYQWRAIFEPYQLRTEAIPGEVNHERGGIPRPFDCNLEAPTYVHRRGDDRSPQTDHLIRPDVPNVLAFEKLHVQPVNLPPEAYVPGLRPFVAETYEKEIRNRLTVAGRKREQAEAAYQQGLKQQARALAPADALHPEQTPAPLVVDDFRTERPDVWQVISGEWTYASGQLQQTSPAETRLALRLKETVPPNFEARLRYRPTAGNEWKSVGISFDVTESGHEVLGYLSSRAAGSKAQIAYRAQGEFVYPNAIQARSIALGEIHELVLRVQGRLVNLLADGDLAVAYQLPIERHPGALELITYDAVADFLSFELHPLNESTPLVAASTGTDPAKPVPAPLSMEQLDLSRQIAACELAVAEAELKSLQSRHQADVARYRSVIDQSATTEPVPGEELRQARLDEQDLLIAKAKLAVRQAELAVQGANEKQKPEVVKKLESARQSLDQAKQERNKEGAYTSLVGAYKTLESNVEAEASRSKPFPSTSTGRRSALAKWVTDRRNPLTARVAVNHIWARHFGRPLVATVFDFGRKGAAPTHPELLDWLAVEFMERGWSMKDLHRLIVTSQTYRLASSSTGADATTLAADPENRWYWRMNSTRMQAQVVRDSLLHLAGQLDLTQGGPPVPVTDAASRRRSLYYVHSHNEHQKFLAIFDDASVLDCYRRSESIVPQQALALENSPLMNMAAEQIARQLHSTYPKSDEFIQQAFLKILSVKPSPEEQQIVEEALSALEKAAERQKQADPVFQARWRIVQALLNHNDFVTIR